MRFFRNGRMIECSCSYLTPRVLHGQLAWLTAGGKVDISVTSVKGTIVVFGVYSTLHSLLKRVRTKFFRPLLDF